MSDIKLELSKESLSLIDDVQSRLSTLKSKVPNGLIKDKYDYLYSELSASMAAKLFNLSSSAALDSCGLDSDMDKLCGILCDVSLIAFSGALFLDINKTVMLEKVAKIASSGEGDYTPEEVTRARLLHLEGEKFGFSELFEIMSNAINTVAPSDTAACKKAIQSGVLVNFRDVNLSVYKEKKLYNNDLALLHIILNYDTYVGNGSNAFKDCIRRSLYKEQVKKTKEAILSVWTNMYQDAFGLNPYVGMVTFGRDSDGVDSQIAGIGKNSCTVLNVSDGGHLYFKDVTSLDLSTVTPAVFDLVSFKPKYSRQFDVAKILKAETPLYYPNKLLELMTGRITTKNREDYSYDLHYSSIDWDKYKDAYVSPMLDDLIYEAIFLTLENKEKFITDYRKKTGIASSEADNFSSPHFDYLSDVDFDDDGAKPLNAISLGEVLKDESATEIINNTLKTLSNSLICGVIIVCYDKVNKLPVKLRIRVSEPLNKLDCSSAVSRTLFAKTTSGIPEFLNGYPISTKEDSLCNMVEYTHIYNDKLTNCIPSFGYKPVELYLKKGVALTWDKILIGYDRKDTPLFTTSDTNSKISIQSTVAHHMVAGSRSGKGVMTMNLLVSAIASGKPIFYLDRKPDMAITFHELTEGSMFIMNGGQWTEKNDPNNLFGRDSLRGKLLADKLNKLDDNIKKVLGLTSTEEENFILANDIIYYRTMVLYASIMHCRLSIPASIPYLGGNDGVVFVIDELTNWQNIFESIRLSNIPGSIFSYCISQGVASKFVGAKKNIKKAEGKKKIADAKASAVDVTKTDRVIQSQLNQEAADEALNDAEDAAASVLHSGNIYATSFYKCYKEMFTEMKALVNAGAKGQGIGKIDVFTIGQDLVAKPTVDAAVFTPTIRGDAPFIKSAYSDSSKYSAMRGLWSLYTNDYFVGRNQDNDDLRYMGQAKGTEMGDLLKNMWWAYTKEGYTSVVNLKSAASDTVLLKPYLVLNRNDEPPIALEGDKDNSAITAECSFVTQCQSRINEAGGFSNPTLWQQIRPTLLDNSTADIKNENGYMGYLHKGIGLRGLTEMVMATTGPNVDFNPVKDLAKSGDIANFVAKALGFNDYIDLLFDFTPKGLFYPSLVGNAIKSYLKTGSANSYLSTFEESFPAYVDYKSVLGAEYDSLNGSDDSDNAVCSPDMFNPGGRNDGVKVETPINNETTTPNTKTDTPEINKPKHDSRSGANEEFDASALDKYGDTVTDQNVSGGANKSATMSEREATQLVLHRLKSKYGNNPEMMTAINTFLEAGLFDDAIAAEIVKLMGGN